MKKTNLSLTVFAILFLCFLNSSSAQYNQYLFGIEGGVGNSALIGNNLVNLDTKPNFSFISGLFGQYNIDQNYSVKMAVNYQLKGAKAYVNQPNLQTGNTIQLNGKIKLDYITIPLMFKATFGSYIKFFANAGPYLGILLTNETTLDPNGNFAGSTTDNTDSTKSTDFGISAGLGLMIPLSTTSMLTLEFRDDAGLTNISEYASNTDYDTKNNSINAMLGITFGFGKKYGKTK